MRHQQTSLSEYQIPNSTTMELQVIADIIALPETLIEAERIITPDIFAEDRCREAYNTLRAMSKEGMTIDLPSAFGRIDQGLMQKGVIPMLSSTGSAITALQHYAALKDYSIKRKCYFKAIELLNNATGTHAKGSDLVDWAGRFAESLRRDIDTEKSIQHISSVLNELGEQIETKQKEKAAGKALRVPTGFYTLDYLTFGGFNVGNLVILAARPSVGKTAVMLQFARAAASAGKAVNLFNLEMTNTELAQRLLCATEHITPLQMARADIDWQMFELASSSFSSRPIYMSDSLFGEDEIIANITLNAQAGRCDIAFVDYLGLVNYADSKSTLANSIASFTKRLKTTAKACKIPIVLLCQLNRLSASEKRAPQLYDLKDSGAIEQDADIVLMLERASGDLDDREVNMWVRKNRQGKAGEVKVNIKANETFTAFTDMDDPTPPPPPPPTDWGNDFDSNSDIPF